MLGGGIKNPEDARTINRRARELGLLDLDRHHPRRLGPAEAARPGASARSSTRCRRRSAGRGRCSRTSTRASAASRTTWPTASRTSGAAAPARATSTSARTASCTTARSSAAIPGVPLETLHDRRHPPRVRRRRSRARRYCTVGCVHRVSTMDFWRKPQKQEPAVPQGSVSEAS